MPQETNRSGENYPLDNLTFNLITIMHKKSRALEAYDKYIEDAQDDEEIGELLEEMRAQDADCVMQLQQHLTRLLTEQGEAGSSANRNTPKTNAARAGSAGKGGSSGSRNK